MQIHPLKAFRENQNPPLSQIELAEMLDVARETVTRWENGSRKIDEQKLTSVARKTKIPARVLRPDLAKLMS